MFADLVALQKKKTRITKIVRFHPLRTTNICTKFHGSRPTISCNVSLKGNICLLREERKLENRQSYEDSPSGDHACHLSWKVMYRVTLPSTGWQNVTQHRHRKHSSLCSVVQKELLFSEIFEAQQHRTRWVVNPTCCRLISVDKRIYVFRTRKRAFHCSMKSESCSKNASTSVIRPTTTCSNTFVLPRLHAGSYAI